jgi:hypothetical protein
MTTSIKEHICGSDEIDYMRALSNENRKGVDMFKKVMFFISLLMTLIVAIYVTGIAALGFLIVTILAGLHVYGKKDLRLWIIVVSAFFLFLNTFSVFSLPDIDFWLLMLLAFAKK